MSLSLNTASRKKRTQMVNKPKVVNSQSSDAAKERKKKKRANTFKILTPRIKSQTKSPNYTTKKKKRKPSTPSTSSTPKKIRIYSHHSSIKNLHNNNKKTVLTPSTPTGTNYKKKIKKRNKRAPSTPTGTNYTRTAHASPSLKISTSNHIHHIKKHKKSKKKAKNNKKPKNKKDNPNIDHNSNLSPKFSSKQTKKTKSKSPKISKIKKKSNKKHTKRSFFGDQYSTATKGKLQTKYKVKEKIGSGTFSTVRRGLRRSDKMDIAIKIITKTELNDTEARLMKREIGCMNKLDHPNIVKLYDIYETTHHLYLIIEYCRGGELFDELINCTPSGWFSEREASQIIKQIAEGLQYMHSKDIIHRDLKLENVLIAHKKKKIKKIIQKPKLNKFMSYDHVISNNVKNNDNIDIINKFRRKNKNKNALNNNNNDIRIRSQSHHTTKYQNNRCNINQHNNNNNNDDDDEFFDDNQLHKLMNRRHSDVLYNANPNIPEHEMLIKISDFGLSKKLDRTLTNINTNNDDMKNDNTITSPTSKKKKKKKLNVLSKKRKQKKKNSAINDREFAVMATNCGTLYYVAPEILEGKPYNEKVDMWSLGVILYVLLCGSLPFYSENELLISDLILKCDYDITGIRDKHWLKVSSYAKDLISSLLIKDYRLRMSAEQVLKHKWITGEKIKLKSQKRTSVKWNAGSLLGKWPAKFRNIIDSAKNLIESDYESDNVNSNNNSNNNSNKKLRFKIGYKNNSNNNHLDPPNAASGATNIYSDISELETENDID